MTLDKKIADLRELVEIKQPQTLLEVLCGQVWGLGSYKPINTNQMNEYSKQNKEYFPTDAKDFHENDKVTNKYYLKLDEDNIPQKLYTQILFIN